MVNFNSVFLLKFSHFYSSLSVSYPDPSSLFDPKLSDFLQ
jgi:hypothetical protein